MNCFNHADRSAIGLCKHCSKGLCPACATDLGHGLACKNSHEKQVEDVNLIVSKNAKIYSSAAKNIPIGPVFNFFMGTVFVGYGYFSGDGVTDFIFVMGVGFIGLGIITLIGHKKIFGKSS